MTKTSKIAKIGMLAAAAFILQVIGTYLGIKVGGFLDVEISDLPALIGALCALIMRFVMPDNMMLGGMGLLLVILMLSRCGVEAHTGGKCA